MTSPEIHFHNSLSVHKGWLQIFRDVADEYQLNPQSLEPIRSNQSQRLHLHDLRHALYQLCEESQDPLLPIKAAQQVTPLTFGSFSLALWTSPTLESLLKYAAEFSIIVSSPVRLHYHLDQQGNAELWVLDSEPFNKESHVTYLGISLFMASVVAMIHKTTLDKELLLEVKLVDHKFDQQNTQTVEALSNVRISDGAPVRKICIAKKYLHRPLPSHEPDIHFAALNLLRKEAETLKKGDLILQIYNILNQCHHLEEVSGDWLATKLNMNIRTLNRRLSDLNTSYRGVVEKYKLEKALHLLADANINMTEIAYQLGFADLSTFSRAFKRWTGSSPVNVRGINKNT